MTQTVPTDIPPKVLTLEQLSDMGAIDLESRHFRLYGLISLDRKFTHIYCAMNDQYAKRIGYEPAGD